MARSMTGFGSSLLTTKEGKFVIELQSVNRRFLEVSFLIPKEYFSFEIDMRKWIGSKIYRGLVTCRLNYYPTEKGISSFLPDISLLKHLKLEWQKRAKELKIEEKTIDLSFLIQQLRFVPAAEKIQEKTLGKILEKVIKKAVDDLLHMKIKEGTILVSDIKKRIDSLAHIVESIEKKAQTSVPKYRKMLQEKLNEYFQRDLSKEERIAQEIFLFAEKIDITEEIVRLKAHFLQFGKILNSGEEVIGRKLEFLLQEMVREINTIGSKNVESAISTAVVDVKTELEKIREQVQNIE